MARGERRGVAVMSGFIYLASPYSHPDSDVHEARYREALDCAAWLLRRHTWVYSPIVHCHVIALRHELDPSFGFWRDYNVAMIDASARVAVLAIEGWRQSKGVIGETVHAQAVGKPVAYVWTRGREYEMTDDDGGLL